MCTHYERRSVLSVNIHLGGPKLPVSASLSSTRKFDSQMSRRPGLGRVASVRLGSSRVGQVVLYIYYISFILFCFLYGFLFFITNVAG